MAPIVSFAEKVLVIDPGHGGKYSGTCGFSGNQTGYCEKHANLDVAIRLKELLKDTDIKVFMTRETNNKDFAATSKEDLIQRMVVANNFVKGNNDESLFLSIHHNAHPTSQVAKGYETYYYDFRAMSESEKQYPPDPIQVGLAEESGRYASLVHNVTLEKIRQIDKGYIDRGLHNDQAFFVIRNAQMPSVLVELGFMTNKDEEKIIKTSQFQQNAAQGLATAVINYFKIYEVYDKDRNKHATFDKKEDALNYAKKQTKYVEVWDKDKQQTIFSSDKFKVYDKLNGFLQEFYTEQDAINFAKNRKNTRIIQDKTGFIVWSDYITPKYEVYSQNKLVGNYLDYDYALNTAKARTNSKITVIGTNEVAWTNISGVPVSRVVDVERLSGTDRYLTAIETSKKIYPNGFEETKEDKTVILATGKTFADALSAGPLASKYGNAPILLTRDTKLNEEVFAEIARLGANKVVIIGGHVAVPEQAEITLRNNGLEVERISGEDRYETNRAILSELGEVSGVFLASGQGFADALAAAPIAAKKGWGVLLTKQSWISHDAITYMSGKEVFIVGGTAAISTKVEGSITDASTITRLSGVDRYETLAQLLWHFSNDLKGETVLVSTGQNFPDALVSAPLAIHNGAPLVLLGNSRNNNVESFLMAYTNDVKVNKVEIIGGTSAINDAQISTITTKLK
jgi:N-acetylmuramoyl-L-alanine amidase/putative cell wall-binding protein